MKFHKIFFCREKALLVAFYPTSFVLIFLSIFPPFISSYEKKFETLEDLRSSWVLSNSDQLTPVKPSDFKTNLIGLDGANGVWVEIHNEQTSDLLESIYKFSGLQNNYCEITDAEIKFKYFAEIAAGYVYPCPGKGCYFDPYKNIIWLETTIKLDPKKIDTEEIEIKMTSLQEGYIMFDEITLSHNGRDRPVDGCFPTTTEETTTTEEITTTEGTTATFDTEATNEETWGPLPTTISMAPTTTTVSTTSISTTNGSPPTEDIEEPETTPGETTTTTTEASTSTKTDSSTTTDTTEGTTDTTDETGDSPSPPNSESTSPSSTTPFIIPPTETTPSSKDGLTLKEILLYVALPSAVLLLLLLLSICYFCHRACKIRNNSGQRFKKIEEEPSSSNRSSNSGALPPPPPIINIEGGGNNLDPYEFYIQSRFNPHPQAPSILQQSPSSAFAPASNYPVSPDTSQFVMQASPTFNRANAFILPPSKAPPAGSILLNIPELARSVNGQGSHRSSVSSASRYPLYTGDYTGGGELPRMRRKLD